jgi:GNAT superfamily N-acetyltransferase
MMKVLTISISGDVADDASHIEFLTPEEIRDNVKRARAGSKRLKVESKVQAPSSPLAYEAIPIPDTLDFFVVMSMKGFKPKRGDFVDDYGNKDTMGLSGEEIGAMYLHLLDPEKVKGINDPYALVCNVKIAKSMQGRGLGIRLYNRALKVAKRYFHAKGLASNPYDRNQRSNPFWKKYGQGKINKLYDYISSLIPEKFKVPRTGDLQAA